MCGEYGEEREKHAMKIFELADNMGSMMNMLGEEAKGVIGDLGRHISDQERKAGRAERRISRMEAAAAEDERRISRMEGILEMRGAGGAGEAAGGMPEADRDGAGPGQNRGRA